MTLATLLLAACLLPLTPVVECSCASIERNELICEETGHTVFVQLIFRDDNEILAWRMAGNIRPVPYRGGWEAMWLDRNVFRRVRAKVLIETTTLTDPEVAEREWLPQEQRRGLGK